ncbi:MAG: double-strand break repair protein AddB [Sphingopyxis sp.]
MTKGPRSSLYTIPLDRAFADALVQGVSARHGGGALDLARGMILLPNARAITAVRDAFIRHGGQAMLLPRLVSLGDGDLDEAAGAALDHMVDSASSPPAIAPLQRQLLLAQMIVDAQAGVPIGEALRLATSVAKVIDQLLVEDVSLDQFCAFKPDSILAEHWNKGFALLQSLLRAWPAKLAEIGLIDLAEARNQQWKQTTAQWEKRGLPARFVVAAGISTSAPAIARLLRVIALAKGGSLVLPHTDIGMDKAEWDALGGDPRAQSGSGERANIAEAHPQYHLKLLLDRMGFHRDEVALWPGAAKPGAAKPGANAGRVHFARTMMTTAEYTDGWPELPPARRTLPGVTLYDLAAPDQEALTIALAMREVLETPGKTAALVTPDRAIAARVAGHMARWGIRADDSAGTPLSTMAAGEVVLALLRTAASSWSPVELIALLSHPLIHAGDDRREWLDHVRALDLILRGPRGAAGLAALGQLIAQKAKKDEALAAWWAELAVVLQPWEEARTGGAMALSALLLLLRATMEQLVGDALWTGADGRALAVFIGDLERDAPVLQNPLPLDDAAAMVRAMMRDVPVRPPYGGHPRLFIWGLIEARLGRADRMILAGLNEGQWPARPAIDPWLAPAVRRQMGLPGQDRQIGLSSHDFTCALGADEVIITRSKRDGGAPTVASRLRLRLDALLGEKAVEAASAGPYAQIAAALDGCAHPVPATRPVLRPSSDKRPHKLSVTEVDVLRVDPFAFYARAALGLRSLERLDAEPTAAWRGTAVHTVLEQWLKDAKWTVEALDRHLDALLSGPGISPIVGALWEPRLRTALHSFAAMVAAGVAEGRQPIIAASEKRGALAIGGITLSGKPDRIDRMGDGTLVIVDYKTGSNPQKPAVEAGFALQLGLLGALAEAGAFPGAKGQVSTFEYWRTNRKSNSDQFGWSDVPFYKPNKDAAWRMRPDSFAAEARVIIEQCIARFLVGDEGFVAKLEPKYALYGDYDQLMRLEEWYGRDGHDPDGAPSADKAAGRGS